MLAGLRGTAMAASRTAAATRNSTAYSRFASTSSAEAATAATTAAARAAPRKRRWPRRVAAAGVVIAIGAAVALPPHTHAPHDAPHAPNNVHPRNNSSIDSALLTLRLSALLATALYATKQQQQQQRHFLFRTSPRDANDSSDNDSSSSITFNTRNVQQHIQDALAVATQLLALARSNTDSNTNSRSHSDVFQCRVVELLADMVIAASAASQSSTNSNVATATPAAAAADTLLHILTAHGLADALLQHVATTRPRNEVLLQKIVMAVEALLTRAHSSDDDDDNSLHISLVTLGAALEDLVAHHALRFIDLVRMGELLMRVQQQQQQHSTIRHFNVAVDNASINWMVDSVRGFVRLLSPEMPTAIKHCSLEALTALLQCVPTLPPALQHDVLNTLLSPSCADLLLALPAHNPSLQRSAAMLLNVLLHSVPQHASLASDASYARWMELIRRWLNDNDAIASMELEMAAATCLRTLSSHPRGQQQLRQSPATMSALYALARRLHESIAVTKTTLRSSSLSVPTAAKKKKSKTATAKTPRPPLALDDALALQRHVSRAVANVCTSYQDGEAALTAQSSSHATLLLLRSKRELPMRRVFERTFDLSDLPIVGAAEYESATDVGWIDILTRWSSSNDRNVRQNAIATLVHLAEPPLLSHQSSNDPTPPLVATIQDHILQAWLTNMLQHIRHLSDGDELLAVKEVETIAQLTDGLTPGNEAIAFNVAVVDAGAAAVAVLVENHLDKLVQQGVVPLMALLSQSHHATAATTHSAFDLKTQCTRVLANLAATSCAQLELEQTGTKSIADAADAVDVEHMLQQTRSGKRLLWELAQWSQQRDPMRRSSYYRAMQNIAAFRALVATKQLDADVYCEGVHPIVPFAEDAAIDSAIDNYSDAAVDVVFVHGLRGHPFGTWRTDMNSALDDPHDIWPDVLLAQELAARGVRARIVTLGYEANMVSWSSPWPSLTLQERSHVMLDALYAANIGYCTNKRANDSAAPRPVVFVTHSMGGILVKKMLLLAHERAAAAAPEASDKTATVIAHHQQQRKQRSGNLATSTRGVVFLAVPHFGSDLANGVRSESVRSLVKAHPAIQDLCANHDGRLEDLNAAFRTLEIDCMSIGEAKAAPLGLGLSAVVVKPESANPGFGRFHVLAGSDHMTICKAKDPDEPHYRAIVEYVLAQAQAVDASTSSSDVAREDMRM